MNTKYLSSLLVGASIWSFASYPVAAAQNWQPAAAPLMTRWAKDVSPTNALPEYPRPQMVRESWLNLNGLWDYALTKDTAVSAPEKFTGQILVPFPYESALSGVGKPSIPDKCLWYRRTFTIPEAWGGQRVLIHFGAVNWETAVLVNGQAIGRHRGGYDGFSFDITDVLKSGENEIMVSVWNPLLHDRPDSQALGKQREVPVSVLYTAASGIWQTVWLEPVPAEHITGLKITPDLDAKNLLVSVEAGGLTTATVRVVVKEGDKVVATQNGELNAPLAVSLVAPHLWSPTDPHIYSLTAELLVDGKSVDRVESYAAMRKISLGKDAKGRTCMLLNNEPLFQVGALDQGYWPDGIYTAPTDEALRYDIEMARKFGFNTLRKHAKAEPDRWYYWADKLGIIVWQDMPQMFGDASKFTADTKRQFASEWQRIITGLYNHPSIIMWTVFNEDWGQHDTAELTAWTKSLDPTRIINPGSGGMILEHDGQRGRFREIIPAGIGDIVDEHDYPHATHTHPDADRAAAVGEFGGITMAVPGHRWVEGRTFAYGTVLRKGWQLDKRYQELLREVWNIKEETGISAVIYTQIADVEAELNGLMTYDRAVIKPDLTIIKAANEGKFPPLPPNPNPALIPTSEEQPIKWQFCTTKPADDWFTASFNANDWSVGLAPFGHDLPGVNAIWQTADIWIRRSFSLPTNYPKTLELLVKHDEDAEIYLNGVLAATLHGFHNDSYLTVPISAEALAALKDGDNTLAAHCLNTIGGQIIDVGLTASEGGLAAIQ